MTARKSKLITKCGFKTKADNANVHSISFNELTSGEVLALIRALMMARTVSPVAQDLSDYLRNALNIAPVHNNGTLNKEQGFMDELNGDLGLAFIRRDDLEQMRKELIELREKVAT